MATKSSCLLLMSLAVMIAIVSGNRPGVVDRTLATSKGSSEPKVETDAKGSSEPKTESFGKMNNGMEAIVSPLVPVPIPGADGQFQFQIGPIGFGWNWNVGAPPLFAYNQPIVVSPYSTPSSPYGPYHYQPQPQYYWPYPAGGYIPDPYRSYAPYPSRPYSSGDQMRTPASGRN